MTNFVDDCFSIRIRIYNISDINYNIRNGILNISVGGYSCSIGRCIFPNVKYNIANGVYNTRDGDCNISDGERINAELFLFKLYSK